LPNSSWESSLLLLSAGFTFWDFVLSSVKSGVIDGAELTVGRFPFCFSMISLQNALLTVSPFSSEQKV
jgi:hypothetical protein